MTNVHTFLKIAIKLAMANPAPKWKLAAVAVRGGRILSVGLNCTQQNESPYGTKPCLRHAETEALRRCSIIPRTIYVARVSKKNIIKLAKPCEICYDAMVQSGVRQIIYTTNTDYGKEKLWMNNS